LDFCKLADNVQSRVVVVVRRSHPYPNTLTLAPSPLPSLPLPLTQSGPRLGPLGPAPSFDCAWVWRLDVASSPCRCRRPLTSPSLQRPHPHCNPPHPHCNASTLTATPPPSPQLPRPCPDAALTLAPSPSPSLPSAPHPIRPVLVLGRVLLWGPLGSAPSFDRARVRHLDVASSPCCRCHLLTSPSLRWTDSLTLAPSPSPSLPSPLTLTQSGPTRTRSGAIVGATRPAHSFDRARVRHLDVDHLPCARSPCFVWGFCTRASALCGSDVFAGLQIARKGVRRRQNKGQEQGKGFGSSIH
jgi:hypothetical protein